MTASANDHVRRENERETASAEERVQKILRSMSTEDKIAQMAQIDITLLLEDGGPTGSS